MRVVQMSGEVKILVKSPNLKFEDRLINCPTTWLINDLKTHLRELLKIKLSHDSKLIHSGKLLNDDAVIGNVFEKEMVHTIYLAMSSSQLSALSHPTEDQAVGSLRKRHLIDSVPENRSSETSDVESNSSMQPPVAHSPNSLNLSQYAHMPMFQSVSGLNYPAFHMPDQSLGSDLSPLLLSNTLSQITWTQHVYAEYMNQYLQYLENIIPQNTVPTEQHQVEHVPPLQNNIQQVAQQPQPQVMNAQGGAFLMDDEEDERNRDWLDWTFVIMRFTMLMCILYFYSTPVRFIAFVIAAIIFFIYQAGWFSVGIFRRHNDNIENQEQNIGAGENENRNINEAQRIIPHFVSTLWSIVVCFFVSLAPQVPPPINAN